MRYVGIDFGEKRFGVCLSDPLLLTAQPKGVLPAKLSALIALLKKFQDEYGDLTVVVGVPLTLKGTISRSTRKVLIFINKLKEQLTRLNLKIKVKTFDERFSTKASEQTLIKAGVSRKKRKKVIDSMAAAFMLQGYLEKIKQ